MIRTVVGGIVAGFILFVIGFVFWATPLNRLAFSNAGAAESAAVQTALAQSLTKSGTGTYQIPNPDTAEGTVLYGKGPVASIHFNTSGFPVDDMNMMVAGLVFALIAGLLIAFALAAAGGRGFAGLARLVVLYSTAITFWTLLAQPVFGHFGWGYWIYSFIAETTALIVAGLVVARWFTPHYPTAAAEPAPATEG
ncbi:MAG TPA: hypothetical protein VFP12_17780 [Allosphingosinicella sp.]|nr:hypothetical protein [Allosphingosinicella sp.]